MGHTLSDARVFRPNWRCYGRRYSAHHGQARRALYCRCVEFHRRRYAVRAQLGALKTTRFCISRFAIIRRLILPSNAACAALRRARRAHISWRGYAPKRTIRPTTSPMRACAMLLPITLKASGNMWTMTFRRSAAIHRSKNRPRSRLRNAHAADRCL